MRQRTLVGVLCVILTSSAFAVPRFALKVGENCRSCHINPTGGGMRNMFGADKYTREDLPWHKDDKFKVNTQLTPNISIGGDFRGQALALDSMWSFASSHVVPGTLGLQSMQASLYLNFKLGEKFSMYFKNDFISANSIEYWGMLNVLPGDGYIKVGAFMPAMGLRVDDHTSFTRYGDYTQTGNFGGFSMYPNSKDLGIEVAEYFGNESIGQIVALAAFSNGDWPNNGSGSTGNAPIFNSRKNILGRLEYYKQFQPNMGIHVGASALVNTFATDTYRRSLASVFGGVNVSMFTLMGEMEWGSNPVVNQGTDSTSAGAMMLELTAEVMRGLVITGKYDTYNPNTSYTVAAANDATPNVTMSRITIGAEFFPIPGFQIIPQVRLLSTARKLSTGDVKTDLKELLLQGHVWL